MRVYFSSAIIFVIAVAAKTAASPRILGDKKRKTAIAPTDLAAADRVIS